jgi:hypothetical protein
MANWKIETFENGGSQPIVVKITALDGNTYKVKGVVPVDLAVIEEKEDGDYLALTEAMVIKVKKDAGGEVVHEIGTDETCLWSIDDRAISNGEVLVLDMATNKVEREKTKGEVTNGVKEDFVKK